MLEGRVMEALSFSNDRLKMPRPVATMVVWPAPFPPVAGSELLHSGEERHSAVEIWGRHRHQGNRHHAGAELIDVFVVILMIDSLLINYDGCA